LKRFNRDHSLFMITHLLLLDRVVMQVNNRCQAWAAANIMAQVSADTRTLYQTSGILTPPTIPPHFALPAPC
jgi:hypothetical protein